MRGVNVGRAALAAVALIACGPGKAPAAAGSSTGGSSGLPGPASSASTLGPTSGGADTGADAGDTGSDTGGADPVVCGDGRRQGQEHCDDGNIRSGDGCEAECRWPEPVVQWQYLSDPSFFAYDAAADHGWVAVAGYHAIPSVSRDGWWTVLRDDGSVEVDRTDSAVEMFSSVSIGAPDLAWIVGVHDDRLVRGVERISAFAVEDLVARPAQAYAHVASTAGVSVIATNNSSVGPVFGPSLWVLEQETTRADFLFRGFFWINDVAVTTEGTSVAVGRLGSSMWIQAFDLDGASLWSLTGEQDGAQGVLAVDATADGGVLILTDRHELQWFDTGGRIIAATKVTLPPFLLPMHVAAVDDGAVVAVSSIVPLPGQTVVGEFAMRVDRRGNVLWADLFPAGGIRAVVVDETGAVIVAGVGVGRTIVRKLVDP